MDAAPAKTLSGVCNFLMSRQNVKGGGLPAAMIGTIGNWVGGRFELTATEFRFTMNAINKLFQKETQAFVIPRSAIRSASRGRMFFIFSTVDLETGFGQFRIRTTGGNTRALLAALQAG
jgi:hypothetical protein